VLLADLVVDVGKVFVVRKAFNLDAGVNAVDVVINKPLKNILGVNFIVVDICNDFVN
jgi:hypothetical protein